MAEKSHSPARASRERAIAALAAGEPIRSAAAKSGLPAAAVYKLAKAHRLLVASRCFPRLSAHERQNIERLLRKAKMSQRAIARRVERSASTVCEVSQRLFAVREPGAIRFRRLRKPVMCRSCRHPTALWPCPVCAARGRLEA